MRDPVAFLLFVSLLAIVFPKGNQGYNQEEYEKYESSIRSEFTWFDENEDDYVDKEEFRITFTPEDIESAFNKYDVDGDGKMNYEEFTEKFLNFDPSLWPDSDIFTEED